jgi:A/G-specific adenine glycosylase
MRDIPLPSTVVEPGSESGLKSQTAPAPEVDQFTQAHSLLALFGTPAELTPMAEFTHVFTHFKLHITPLRGYITQRHCMVAESRYVWYDMAQLTSAPLPAPIKSLLLGLA